MSFEPIEIKIDRHSATVDRRDDGQYTIHCACDMASTSQRKLEDAVRDIRKQHRELMR